MAMRDNSAEILSYIGELSATAELCEPELYCKNPSVNAVVSEYMNRAKKLGCKIKNKILIPENIPFDLPDVCVILSNALENALNACEILFQCGNFLPVRYGRLFHARRYREKARQGSPLCTCLAHMRDRHTEHFARFGIRAVGRALNRDKNNKLRLGGQ